MRTASKVALAAALVTSLGVAQIQAGARMPAIELTGFTQTGATSVGDLAGRVVLYEFFAYW